MRPISKITSYVDIREYVSQAAFTSAMNFLAWHNRLKMTHMLEPWKALVIAQVCEARPLDPLEYTTVKTYCAEQLTTCPQTLDQIREMSALLETSLGRA